MPTSFRSSFVTVPNTGFPNESNTGPANGTIFTTLSGDLNVTTNGSIIENFFVTGTITVNANNVIVRNCKVDGSGQNYCVQLASTHTGLTVTRCELYGIPITANRPASHVLTAVACDSDASMAGVEISFNNIHGIENAIGGGNLYIHDNYIHDFALWTVGADTDHTDGVQTSGSIGVGGMRINHNTIIGICTAGDLANPIKYAAGSSCIALSEDMHDITISNNFFAGGGYALYGNNQDGLGGHPANTIVTNNRFSQKYFPNADFPAGSVGSFGPYVGFDPLGVGFVWSGNVYHETGLPVVGP